MMTPERLAEIRAGVEDFADRHPDVVARYAYDLLAEVDRLLAQVAASAGLASGDEVTR